MKKQLRLLAITATLSLGLCSCSGRIDVSESVSTPAVSVVDMTDNTPPQELKADFTCGLSNTTLEPPTAFNYSKAIAMELYVDNSGAAADFGVLIFIDGILQKCTLRDSDKSEYMPVVSVKSNQVKVISLSFEPQAAKQADSVDVYYCFVYMPTYRPQSADASFGECNSLRSLNVMSLVGIEPQACGNVSISTAESITPDKTASPDALSIALEPESGGKLSDGLTADDKLKLTLSGSSGSGKNGENIWRVCMIVDGAPVPAFDGKRYIDMAAGEDIASSVSVALSELPDNGEDYASAFFIAVPTQRHNGIAPVATESFVLNRK